jgi:L-ribulose-5-phosphate 3-epimerase
MKRLIENSIGVMQGRLLPPAGGKIQSFPKTGWRQEFFTAKAVGLSHIEWIFEGDEWEKNPIITQEGVKEIKKLIGETSVRVEAVCADYFMDFPYFDAADEARRDLQKMLCRLVVQTKAIGGKFIDLPFVDASQIRSKDEFRLVREFISPALEAAEKAGIIIALETSLAPADLRTLLLLINHHCLQANYDTGNSSSLGYDCREELTTYGEWIRTVHIKDRVLKGGTVPLGTGNADFDAFFSELSRLDYRGPIILQAAREGDEAQTALKNIRFVMSYLNREGR